MIDLNTDYKKNWSNSLRSSIVLHLFILLIAFLFKFKDDPKQDIDTQYAVTVSFQQVEFRNSRSSNSNRSKASEGAQRAKSEAPKKIETAKPTKVEVPVPTPPKPTPQPPAPNPEPTEPVISETTTEESDIQAVEEPIDVEDPEPEYIPQEPAEPEPTEEVVITNSDLPTLDDIIADVSDEPMEMEEEPTTENDDNGNSDDTSNSTGTSSEDPSIKDGDGESGRGDSGTGKGNNDSGNDSDSGVGDGGYGEGEFDDSGDGIFGRKVIFRDPSMVRLVSGKSGKIVFKVCINRRGNVSFLEIDEFATTIKDNTTLRNALSSMQKYKYEVDYSAPREQCGKFTVTIDNYRGFNN